jgi:tetratricopeptide (TPR) repeat protein
MFTLNLQSAICNLRSKMTTSSPTSGLTPPTAEQRRQAALHFDRASQLVATGAYLPGIRLLGECCQLDPANLLYRQALRRAEKTRFGNNLRGSRLAWLFAWRHRGRLRAARAAGRYLDVLLHGERILVHNPWDVPTQLEMASAADILGLLDLAIWILEQARHKDAQHAELNRRLARLYERRGNFTQALALWELVKKVAPEDEEASRKLSTASQPQENTPFAEQLRAARAQIDEEPTQPTGYLDLARLHRQTGRLDEARKALLDGLPATGNAFDLIIELHDLEIDPFRRDLTITQAKLTMQPEDAGLQRIQHELRREINSRELELYRLLADHYPGRPVYRYEVGVRLLRAGMLAEAVEELRAVRGEDLQGEALLALAHGFRGRQNLRQALHYFNEALHCLPETLADRRREALYELARCHAELGELPRAVSLANDLIRLDPAHPHIGRLLEEWAQSRERS